MCTSERVNIGMGIRIQGFPALKRTQLLSLGMLVFFPVDQFRKNLKSLECVVS